MKKFWDSLTRPKSSSAVMDFGDCMWGFLRFGSLAYRQTKPQPA